MDGSKMEGMSLEIKGERGRGRNKSKNAKEESSEIESEMKEGV